MRRILISHTTPWDIKTASHQKKAKYTLFADWLLTVDEAYNFDDIFGAALFDKAKRVAQIRAATTFGLRLKFWVIAILTIFLLGYTIFTRDLRIAALTLGCASLSIGLASLLAGVVSRNRGLTKADIISQAKDPSRAKLVLDELESKIFETYEFAVIDGDGRFKRLPFELPRAVNGLVFLLGQTEHRYATNYSGEPPSQDLYISKSKGTKDTRISEAIVDFLKSKEAISDLLALVGKHKPFDPAKPSEKLSRKREGWINLLRLIHANWPKWTNLLKRKNSDVAFELSLTEPIKIRGKSPSEMYLVLNDLISGKNRHFGNWLRDLNFIDSATLQLKLKYQTKS